MKHPPLKLIINSLFEKGESFHLREISKSIDIDKSKLSGYLAAMVDYGDLRLKKVGPSHLYSRKGRRKK